MAAIAWDISGSTPLPSPPPLSSRSSAITASTTAGSTTRPASAAGPVTASRNSASLIGPTVNGPASSAAFNGGYAMRRPR